MVLLLLRGIAVLIGTGLGAYTDFKTGLIFDRITVPMIVLGLALNVFEVNLNQADFTGFEFLAVENFYWVFLAAVVFGLGYVMYYAGKIGGGDVKLFTGIALLLPFLNGFPFVLAVLLVAAVAAVLFLSVYYVGGYLLRERKLVLAENRRGIIRSGMLLAVLVAYFYFLTVLSLAPVSYLVVLGIPALAALAFIAFEHGIRRVFFLKTVTLEALDEDDIIAREFMDEKDREKIGMKVKGIIDEKEKRKLEGLGFKEVLVYRDLPKFAPFIFIGALVIMAFPETIGLFMP